jgi:hypothetical protein
MRINGGLAPKAPMQRAIFASSRDPFETFTNNYWRPRGALLKQFDMTVTPLGGARLRGFGPGIAFDAVTSANVGFDQRVGSISGAFGSIVLWAGVFGDAGLATLAPADAAPPAFDDAAHMYFDLGAGIRLRGRFYDREVDLRIDAPGAVNSPLGTRTGLSRPDIIRWTFDLR